jgi:hypothetical protein
MIAEVTPILTSCTPINIWPNIVWGFLLTSLIIGFKQFFNFRMTSKSKKFYILLNTTLCVLGLYNFDKIVEGWDGCPSDLNDSPHAYSVLEQVDKTTRKVILYQPLKELPRVFMFESWIQELSPTQLLEKVAQDYYTRNYNVFFGERRNLSLCNSKFTKQSNPSKGLTQKNKYD